MNEWIQLGPSSRDGSWANTQISDELVGIMVHQGNGDTQVVVLLYDEILSLVCLLPEVKALFQWAKDVREQVDEGHLFLLEAVADEIFEPFEGKGEKDE